MKTLPLIFKKKPMTPIKDCISGMPSMSNKESMSLAPAGFNRGKITYNKDDKNEHNSRHCKKSSKIV